METIFKDNYRKGTREMNNNFLDYCFGTTLILFGVSILIIAIGLVTGVIK